MEDTRAHFSKVGIALGSIGLLLALVHFWVGPFAPQPTFDTVVAQKALSIRTAALDAFKGKEPVEETYTKEWNADTVADLSTALLGGLALIFAVLGFVNKEPNRVSGGAAMLGIGAIAFQFFAMYVMLLLFVMAVGVAVKDFGVG